MIMAKGPAFVNLVLVQKIRQIRMALVGLIDQIRKVPKFLFLLKHKCDLFIISLLYITMNDR